MRTVDFYFMEMNTRLQVEHPVTEAITGLDLVEWQLRVASGERLPLAQHEIRSQGHAIEARLYSEDPRRGFLPSVGRVERFVRPAADEHWRVDAGIEDGDAVTVHYDPMIAKVVASGADRADALATLKHQLDRTAIFGVANNLPLLRAISAHPQFAAGDVDTGFVDRELATLMQEPTPAPESLLLAASIALDELVASGPRASPWSRADGWRAGKAQRAVRRPAHAVVPAARRPPANGRHRDRHGCRDLRGQRAGRRGRSLSRGCRRGTAHTGTGPAPGTPAGHRRPGR